MIPSAIATPRSSPPRGSAGTSLAGYDPLPYWLSGGLIILLVVASAAGLFIPGPYRDSPNWIAQTRGTDLVTLTVAVPALVASLALTAGGSLRAQVVWLGVLGYVLYMYVICAFAVAFNPLFLVYVAALSLSFWSLVTVLPRMNRDDQRIRFAPNLPVRSIAGYLLVVAALFGLAWLKDIIPATVGNRTPASLQGLKLPTNPVHVLDLSILLPLAALSGIWLWQRRSRGYLLAGILLTTMTIIGVSIISGTVFEYINDPKTSLTVMPLLVVVTLAGLWLLVGYLRTRPASHPRNQLTLPFIKEVLEIQQEYPRADRFRVQGLLAQRTGEDPPSERTVGRAIVLNRQHHNAPGPWITDKQPAPEDAELKDLPFEPTHRHRYWFVDYRYLVRLAAGDHWAYSLCIFEGYSRKILAGMATEYQDTVAVPQLLAAVLAEHGRPEGIVSDNGAVFTSDAYEGLLQALQIEVCHIEKGKPWENLAEAQFKIQLRSAACNLLSTLRHGCAPSSD